LMADGAQKLTDVARFLEEMTRGVSGMRPAQARRRGGEIRSV